jgi:hypothetical protein
MLNRRVGRTVAKSTFFLWELMVNSLPDGVFAGRGLQPRPSYLTSGAGCKLAPAQQDT